MTRRGARSFPDSSAAARPKPGIGSHPAGGHPVVLFTSDGMRPDLMQRCAAAGAMPSYANLARIAMG